MAGSTPPGWPAVDAAVRAGAGAAFSFLESLIAARSTVGEEAWAQEVEPTGLDPGTRGTAPGARR